MRIEAFNLNEPAVLIKVIFDKGDSAVKGKRL